MQLDLFNQAAVMERPVHLDVREIESFERQFCVDMAMGCFKERPTEKIWQWAAREVWLGEKMSATPTLYDPTKTPWTKELQELPMNERGIRAAYIMKDSRSGFSEASLNILRWMPEHWPGGALYSINSQEKAREVAQKRYHPTLKATAGAYLSLDPDDVTLSKISLSNMEVLFSGSGASGPFMEAWYRLIILDELENHIQNQKTTTDQRAKSRQTDVPDGLIICMSKPEHRGGIIDLGFISGSQKKYLVPCPRCERRIELSRKLLVYHHCFQDGEWDLDAVLRDTYWNCPLCSKAFYESEKWDMVNSDLAGWVPTPPDQRRRPPTGKYVPPDPTVESYHMSSYYSLHERATGGNLALEILKAEVLNPTAEAKKYVMTNFDGLPFEEESVTITAETVKSLIAGHVIQTKIKLENGTEEARTQVLAPDCLLWDRDGNSREPIFHLAYRNGVFSAELPCKPALLTIKADKQANCLKYLVFAIMYDSTPLLVDIGIVPDEDALFDLVKNRQYWIAGADEPMYIRWGFVDAGHRPLDVYKFCLKCYDVLGANIWPVRGEGEQHDKDEETTFSKDANSARKTFRYVDDWVEGRKIAVLYFYDASIKNDFYRSMVQNRQDPRPWLPKDVPDILVNEWTAEHYDEKLRAWVHEKNKTGPNDYGDCGKYLSLFFQRYAEDLKALAHEKPED